MDEKNYKITLADGTELTDLQLNGNNFISEIPVDESMFDMNCSPVTISDGENEETHENMELVQIAQIAGKYWFILRDLTAEELFRIKMQSDLEYLSMMTGVDL